MKKHLIHHIKKNMIFYLLLGGVYKLLISSITIIGIINLLTPTQHSSAQTVYTIIATTNNNNGGDVNPQGTITVNAGDTISFTFQTNPGFMLKDVQIDGNSIGPQTTYTFTDISSNHTIHGIFERIYTITTQTENGATITPGGTVQVPAGENQNFTFNTISNIYGIKAIIVDKTPVSPLSTSYNFTEINKDHSLIVQGERLPEQINSAIINCTNQTVTIPFNMPITQIAPIENIIISKDKQYQTNASILKRGKNLEIDIKDLSRGSYEIQILPNTLVNELLNVQTNFFFFTKECKDPETKMYDIIIKIMSGKGKINPEGIANPETNERKLTVAAESSQTITILPDPGYTYDKIIIDGVSTITNANSITFSNIQSNHTLEVYFKPAPTSSQGGGGGGGSSISIDNCPYGDYSPSYYDNDCGYKPATAVNITTSANIPAQCANEKYLRNNLITCFGLTEKAKLLKALNDQFVQIMANIDKRDTTLVVRTPNNNTPENTTRIKLLQSAANSLTNINNTLTNIFNNQAKNKTSSAK